MFDIIVRNGFVCDGGGSPGFEADVAVSGDLISAVGRSLPARGAREIDARGKLVIPGFIDPHVHEELVLFTDNGFEPFLRQGVTTTINGNCGHSVTPGNMEYVIEYYYNNGLLSPANRKNFKSRFPSWSGYREYIEAARRTGSAVNLAVLLGHGTIRQYVMKGAHDRPPSVDEKTTIDRVLLEGMEQGAWGVSFGLDYVPSRYAKTGELIDVARVVGPFGGTVTAHLRNWIGTKAAVEEMVEVCRAAKAKVQISHLKSSAEDAFETARAAADSGLPVRIDTIPKSSGHCNRKDKLLQSIMAISDSLFDKGIEGVKAALRSREGREIVKRDSHAKFGMDKEKVFIVLSDDPSLEGKSIAQIARERGDADPTETMLDLAGDDGNYTFWLGGPLRDDFCREHGPVIVSNPYVSVGTDRIMGDPEDPRFWYELQRPGGFPNFLNMYRKAGVGIEEIVRRNTSLPADHFGIARRGRIREGWYADLTVLDLGRYSFPDPFVIDPRKPITYAEGVEYVIVNGAFALDEGNLTRMLSGRMLLRTDR